MAPEEAITEASQFLKTAVSPIVEARGSSVASSPGREAKALIMSAADGLVLEVSKMAVLFSGTGQPSETEATGILHTFQQRFAALCAVVHSVVAGAGPTMHSAVKGTVNALLSSCQAFLDDLKSEDGSVQLPQRVGVIRERCEAVKRIPLNNAVALGRKLTLCARQMKDAHREARDLVAAEAARGSASLQDEQPAVATTPPPGSEELQQHQSSAQQRARFSAERGVANGSAGHPSISPGGDNLHSRGDQATGSSVTDSVEDTSAREIAPGAGGVEAADGLGVGGAPMHAGEEADSKGGFEDYETDELIGGEREVAAAAEEVIGLVVEMLNTVIQALLRGAVPVGEDLESWESCGFHCRNLETTVNDLVAELYGPQDAEEVSSACHAVATGRELILEELPSSAMEQHGSELAEIDRRLTSAQDVLDLKVAQLLQEQQGRDLSSEE